jgi:hypothetical protein
MFAAATAKNVKAAINGKMMGLFSTVFMPFVNAGREKGARWSMYITLMVLSLHHTEIVSSLAAKHKTCE